MTDEEPQTTRERVYDIRRRLGPDRKTPLSQGEFAKRINATAAKYGLKAGYDASVVSKVENGLRTVTIEEVPLFAALDPKKRGVAWLAWGIQSPVIDAKTTAHRLTEAEMDRAVAAGDAEEAAEEKASTKRRRKRG